MRSLKMHQWFSVELNNGEILSGVLIVYPNHIGAIEGKDDLVFSPKDVVKVFQTEEDLKKRSNSSWSWLYDPNEFRRL